MNKNDWESIYKNTLNGYCKASNYRIEGTENSSKSKTHTIPTPMPRKWWRWPFMKISRHEKEMQFLEMQNFELRGAIRSAMDENRKLKMQIERLGRQS